MKITILLILTISVAVLANKQRLFENTHSPILKNLFQKFIDQHNKLYSAENFIERFLIFSENLMKHASHLLLEEDPKFSPFFDLTVEEFENQYLTLSQQDFTGYGVHINKNIEVAPESLDYRTLGAVTAVKNQGGCGACWAFSAVANIEGQVALKKKISITLSEQQLIECNKNKQGCNGGLMTSAFGSVVDIGGIESDIVYPYTQDDSKKCQFDKTKVAAKLSGFNQIKGDEDHLVQAIFENGPVSVGINATPLQWYTSGVLNLNATLCNPKRLNHGVTIIGFGTENGIPFYIVKNSWGANWGENGFFRISRGKNTCGINTDVSTAVLSAN